MKLNFIRLDFKQGAKLKLLTFALLESKRKARNVINPYKGPTPHTIESRSFYWYIGHLSFIFVKNVYNIVLCDGAQNFMWRP